MSNTNAKADWLAMIAIEREFPGLASSGPVPVAGPSVGTVEGKNPKHSGMAMMTALQKLAERHRTGPRVQSSRPKKRRGSFKRQRAGSV